ncbi:hypothetical protein B0A49_10776, partial [Cryomyces minteri]
MALPTKTGSVSDAQNNPPGLADAETADFQSTRSEQPQMLQASQAPPPRTRRKQVEDPREFQLGQMRRRYSPKEEQTNDGTSLTFAMAPSDPDFPFDIEALECILHVPLTYPANGRPSLRVTNKQMGRGYQINVERGFDAIATDAPDATLLGLMNRLDKQLETLLSAQKADTIKLVSNVGRAPLRPPEWTVGGEEQDGSSSDDGSLTYDSGDDTEEEEPEDGPVASQTTPAERGIMLSFPFLVLHGIELLELVSLSITVKCERCKDLMDVERLKNNITGDYSGVRQLSCKKCANPLGISYRMDMMHANSVRAGYLDLDGCTVVDMLVPASRTTGPKTAAYVTVCSSANEDTGSGRVGK